ncbi:MAG: glycosyltransferase family 4 protein [Bacteroidetes bacterium]|nr:glycosyltransferase family 4 protein [Bacteroidota bacterium]
MSEKIRIGLDIRDLRIAKTGSKTYLEEIYNQFKSKQYDCEFVFFDTSFPVYTGRYKLLKLTEHLRFFIWKQIMLPLKANLNRCDILFCTDYFVPYFTPGFKAIPVFYDAFFFEYASHYNPIWLKLFKILGVRAAKKSPNIITITEYARNRISHFTGIDKQKIKAIHLAPKKMAVAEPEPGYIPTFKIPTSKFILHVGTMEKRKNLVRLIEAFNLLRISGHHDYSLVLVGQPSPKADMDDSVAIHEMIDRLALRNYVLTPGYSSDQDLAYFYKHADIYAFPSINEGFGVPILEAFHHGLPVIVSDNTCLPEVGGDAVLSFDPFSIEDISNKMKILSEDHELKSELIRKGRERLKLFSWEKNAEELIKTFRVAIKKN